MKIIESTIKKIYEIFNVIRGNKIFRKVIVAFSIIYPFILLYLSWSEIISIQWSSIGWRIAYVFILYFLSLMFQGVAWTLIINQGLSHYLDDLNVYIKSILMRRLPGGFWHWIGRSNLYEDLNYKPKTSIAYANIIEWICLILTGFSWFLLIENRTFGIILCLFSFIVIYFLINRLNRVDPTSIILTISFLVLYSLSWIFGGWILQELVVNVFGTNNFSLTTAISVWALSGTIGMLTFFLPGGLFFREFSLLMLLSTHLSYSKILLLALVIRIVFVVSDILFSLVGFLILNNLIRKPKPNQSL